MSGGEPAPRLLPVGSAVPEVEVAVNGSPTRLRDALKGGAVWLFFYPLAFAPTCREDLGRLERAAARLGAPGTRLWVASVDRLDHVRGFLEEIGASALVPVPDPELRLARAFGVERREGVCERASFLLSREGTVERAALHSFCFPRDVDTLAGPAGGA